MITRRDFVKTASCSLAAARPCGGNTDTLVHRNDSDEDQELRSSTTVTVMTEDVGRFLINVGIFER